MLLATELLQERDDLPPDVVEAHAMIRRNVELEARFVDDLLDVTRIVRGKVELERQPLDLHEVDYTNGGAGLGIQVGDPADRGQGYGGDALNVLVDFAFEQLRLERVWLDVYETNPDARRLYERVGFVHEATFRHGVFRAGGYEDVQRLAILRSEWTERRAAVARTAEPA